MALLNRVQCDLIAREPGCLGAIRSCMLFRAVAVDTDIDDIDRRILEQLQRDGREPAARIGRLVNLSPAAVRKRIDRLRAQGVIRGFTVVLDHASVHAYVEVTFDGGVDVPVLLRDAVNQDRRIREASTIAGDPDAILRVRVKDNEELRDIVTWLRRHYPITRTKALVALDRIEYDPTPGSVDGKTGGPRSDRIEPTTDAGSRSKSNVL
jgi:Lrp/AsnC family leucine-responsive transcriptional regulator